MDPQQVNKPQIGLQLYTLRDQMACDFSGTLRQVAEIGFRGVETAFFSPDITLERASRELRDLNLQVFCAHTDLPLSDKRDDALRTAEAFGCKRIVWHGWPEDARYSSLAGIQALIEEYNAAEEVASKNGLHLGLHNHWWEMTPVEGQLPHQLLAQHLNPRIFFELDVYWATVAGRDAVQLINNLGSRAPLLHVKDGPAVRHQPMTAIGAGVLNIPAIVQAAVENNAEWLIIELDECATDMMETVRQSYQYLSKINE